MSDVDKKLAEIRERHELGDRWRYGPSLLCPQSHEDRAFLLNEITRLRARVEELESLARELAEGDASRDEITRFRAGLQKIVEGDGFWDAPSLARDLLEGKDVT
jgi:hypothetical protein